MLPNSGLEEFEGALTQNVPLAGFTTLGVGGPATFFAEIASAQSLAAGVAWASAKGAPLFVLGGGSNVVVADTGFPGLVLRVNIRAITSQQEGESIVVTAGAGEEWDPFVALCVSNNWAGVECLSGIPGRVGATPIQNVGAYGQETSETLVALEAFDRADGKVVAMSGAECEFGYRTSRFKTRDRDRFIITSATYRLTPSGAPAIRYPELQGHIREQGVVQPALVDVRNAVLAIRRRKAMVIDPADPDSRSVGSFFVNPVVTNDEYEQVKERARESVRADEAMPAFPTPPDRVKLSAAWIIERAGFPRGYVHGNVGISTKHALAIVNRGGGTAREIIELADQIKARVAELFGVTLTPEPVFVGFKEH